MACFTIPQTWPFLALLVLLLVVYLIATEIQSQDCEDRYCYNTTPQALSNDDPREMIDKIIITLRVNHSPVEWRKALLIGILVATFVILITGVSMTLRNFVLIGLIVFIIVYFAATWTNWTYWRDLDTCLERRLIDLRSRL